MERSTTWGARGAHVLLCYRSILMYRRSAVRWERPLLACLKNVHILCNNNNNMDIFWWHLAAPYTLSFSHWLECYNHAVPASCLHDILMWMEEGVTMEDIISRLTPTTVPAGYICHFWKLGWCSVLGGEVLLVLLSCIALFRVRGELYRQDEFSDGLNSHTRSGNYNLKEFISVHTCMFLRSTQ